MKFPQLCLSLWILFRIRLKCYPLLKPKLQLHFLRYMVQQGCSTCAVFDSASINTTSVHIRFRKDLLNDGWPSLLRANNYRSSHLLRAHQVLRLWIGTLHTWSHLIFTAVRELGLSTMNLQGKGQKLRKLRTLTIFTLTQMCVLLTIMWLRNSIPVEVRTNSQKNGEIPGDHE